MQRSHVLDAHPRSVIKRAPANKGGTSEQHRLEPVSQFSIPTSIMFTGVWRWDRQQLNSTWAEVFNFNSCSGCVFLKEERCPEASTGTKSADDRTRICRLHLLPHFNVNVKCHAQVDIKDHYVH